MEASRKSGLWGEIYASRKLNEKGYTVLTSNYRCRLGEIDLIAINDEFICFVEVKTRGENSLYLPREAVDFSKQSKIIATAKLFLKSHTVKLQPRFDVCEVYLDSKFKPLKINYIENAFSEGI